MPHVKINCADELLLTRAILVTVAPLVFSGRHLRHGGALKDSRPLLEIYIPYMISILSLYPYAL